MSADDPHFERDAPRDGERYPPRDPALALDEALQRSRRHARAALSEAVACLGALLDAASLATSGVPAESHTLLRRLYEALAEAAASLTPDSDSSRELMEAIAAALDQEIARWESRADADPDARAVLRAFLGMRELLWEFGVRRQRDTRARGPRVTRPDSHRSQTSRVQRVRVQGAGPGA